MSSYLLNSIFRLHKRLTLICARARLYICLVHLRKLLFCCPKGPNVRLPVFSGHSKLLILEVLLWSRVTVSIEENVLPLRNKVGGVSSLINLLFLYCVCSWPQVWILIACCSVICYFAIGASKKLEVLGSGFNLEITHPDNILVSTWLDLTFKEFLLHYVLLLFDFVVFFGLF